MSDLVHWFGLGLGFIPVYMIIDTAKGLEQGSTKNLWCGLGLIVVAVVMLAAMNNLTDTFDFLLEKGKITETDQASAKFSSTIWAIMFPAVVGALGVNLVTAWIQAPCPEKK
ncbi:hypothetical protein [Vibrio parahaemolyticus]|uniref:hypothetical protein n=1 Tax=Vibrio parahaemolyticus TaxID=670 RepID=UPI0023614567|nr:hypothetical protein [Vibrio parahaemolyticus]